MKYDVVIIGSGLGGLVCASLLSRHGRHVLVLERQTIAGGCMQSFQRRGHSFDTGLHYIGGLAEGQRLQRIFNYLGLMKLPWKRLDADGFDRITIGQQTFRFAEGYDHFVDTLAEQFPHERQSLTQYVQMLQRIEEEPLDSQGMYNNFGFSAYNYLHESFHDDLLINVLSGSALKMELRPESLPLFTFAHGNSSFIGSSWRLQGSGNLLVQTLADNIRANGGDIICKTEATEFIERNGQLEAVRCTNGETYEADIFISDIHPVQTFAMVKDSHMLKNVFRRRFNMLQNTFGAFTTSLLLKPESLPYFNHNKFIYRNANVWTFYEESKTVGGVMVSARVPEDNSQYVRQIDLLTPMTWDACQQWADTSVGHRCADYKAMKERLANECIELAETQIPGLGQMIEEQYTSTPLTWRDYTLTPNGSAYGLRKDCRNLLLTMLSPRTPIPNLLLTGQNLMLHGVEGVTMTALKTCAEVEGQTLIKKILN